MSVNTVQEPTKRPPFTDSLAAFGKGTATAIGQGSALVFTLAVVVVLAWGATLGVARLMGQ